jgi:hypothetical protein
MPGAADRYEHVGACFLNESDTAARLVATARRAAARGLTARRGHFMIPLT